MSRSAELAGLAVVLLVAALLRLGALGADVPLHPGSDYSPLQDAFWYLESASSAAEGLVAPGGGPSDPEPEYDPPVWTSVGRVWLQVLGSSWRSACALGAVVGLALVLVTWRLARAALGPGAGLASAAVLATLHPAVLESRAPQVYGPTTLWLLTAAGVWLHGRGRPPLARAACEVLAWAMVLAAALAVRPPAAALAGGLLCGHLVRAPRLRSWALAVVALGAAWTGLALAWGTSPFGPLVEVVAWVDPARASMLRYRLDLHGGGDATPGQLLLRALRFGGPPRPGSGSGFLALAPAACAVAALGASRAWVRLAGLRPAARETLALLLGWGLAFFLGGLFMERRPLRYFVLVAPALAVSAGLAIAWTGGGRGTGRSASSWSGLALLGALAGAHALELLLGPCSATALSLAAVAGGLMAVAAGGWSPASPAPARRRLLALALLAAACLGGLARGCELLLFPTRITEEANRTLLRIVDPGAVLCGPYASPLAIGSGRRRLRGTWIHPDPVELLDASLSRMRAERVTHLVLDIHQERGAELMAACAGRGVQLERVALLVVAEPPPRGTPVLVLRLPWARELGYTLSQYETRQAQDAQDRPPTEADPQLLAARLRALAHAGKIGAGSRLLERSLFVHRDLGRYQPLLELALAGR